ncbi:unnamed protein product, partial [Effrenium voratum]
MQILVLALLGPAVAKVPSRSWEESYKLADETLERLSPWQRSRLLNGVGWRPDWQLTPGFYIGNIAGSPSAGVPWLRMQDSAGGFRTLFPEMVGTSVVWPSSLALASTWDEQAVADQAAAIAKEFRGKNANVMLGPAVNIVRTALGGRNFEFLPGEDPYLGARLVRSFVTAVQSQGVMVVL